MEVWNVPIFTILNHFEGKVSPPVAGFLLIDVRKTPILKNFGHLGLDITFKMAANFKHMNEGVENCYFLSF